MNINDIDSGDIPNLVAVKGAWLDAIFERQKELHEKYKPIELASGIGLAIVEGVDFSLSDRRYQYLIKDFAWRVTEELAEAGEAADINHETHHVEELIDALHFYTELMIVVKVAPRYVVSLKGHSTISDTPNKWDIIQPLGLAMNTLKQKPWKQHHFATDVALFYNHLMTGYIRLLLYIESCGLNELEIYQVYMKKSEVNKFRIRSRY
jgi:hypothetical protein